MIQAFYSYSFHQRRTILKRERTSDPSELVHSAFGSAIIDKSVDRIRVVRVSVYISNIKSLRHELRMNGSFAHSSSLPRLHVCYWTRGSKNREKEKVSRGKETVCAERRDTFCVLFYFLHSNAKK